MQKSSGSVGEGHREEKFFSFNFPSINQIDLDMRMDDFNEEQLRQGGAVVGSMIKI